MVSIVHSPSLAQLHSVKFHSSSRFSRTDANRFGQAYLEKFGWDASKGLGASGEGRTSAIKAT